MKTQAPIVVGARGPLWLLSKCVAWCLLPERKVIFMLRGQRIVIVPGLSVMQNKTGGNANEIGIVRNFAPS